MEPGWLDTKDYAMGTLDWSMNPIRSDNVDERIHRYRRAYNANIIWLQQAQKTIKNTVKWSWTLKFLVMNAMFPNVIAQMFIFTKPLNKRNPHDLSDSSFYKDVSIEIFVTENQPLCK